MRIGVGIPWSSPFFFTAAAFNAMNLKTPEGCEMRIFQGVGWCPARRHIHIAEQALDWGADLICIIGADQLHPEDMIVRLVERIRAGHEVVAALVPSRGYVGWQEMKPFQPMAWRWKTSSQALTRGYRGMELDADMLEVIDPKAGEMQQVNFIGSGVLMFHRDHLLAMRKPWFAETIDRQSFQRIANMDCTFVWRLQMEAHARVWVDTTIEVKHLHVFEIDGSYQERFEDWTRPGQGDPKICRYAPASANP